MLRPSLVISSVIVCSFSWYVASDVAWAARRGPRLELSEVKVDARGLDGRHGAGPEEPATIEGSFTIEGVSEVPGWRAPVGPSEPCTFAIEVVIDVVADGDDYRRRGVPARRIVGTIDLVDRTTACRARCRMWAGVPGASSRIEFEDRPCSTVGDDGLGVPFRCTYDGTDESGGMLPRGTYRLVMRARLVRSDRVRHILMRADTMVRIVAETTEDLGPMTITQRLRTPLPIARRPPGRRGRPPVITALEVEPSPFYPNAGPYAPSSIPQETTISFRVDKSCRVNVTVYTYRGKLVTDVDTISVTPGRWSVRWNGRLKGSFIFPVAGNYDVRVVGVDEEGLRSRPVSTNVALFL